MPRLRSALLAFLIAVTGLVVVAQPASAQSASAQPASAQPASAQSASASGADRGHRQHSRQYYVSLGDSLARGVQPDAAGNNQVTDNGYPDQLTAQLTRGRRAPELVKLGCPGATAATLANGGDSCPYSSGNQLDDAVAALTAHHGDIALLTINVGSNDVIGGCVDLSVPTIDTECVTAGISQLPATLGGILDQLNAALDRRTPRIGMTYYDPYLGLAAINPALQQLADDSLALTTLLNQTLSGIYQQHGFAVADVAGAFRTNDTAVEPPSPLPANVTAACQWTYFCTPTPNIHPTTEGYGVIAQAFAAELRSCRRR